jgi:hypothetical protein
MRAAAFILATSIVMLGVHEARAAGGLSYHAPAECPDRHVFVGEVAKRARAQRAAQGAVSIAPSASDGYVGRLVVEGLEREVHAETCAEVVEALALAVALAAEEVDEASTLPSPTPEVAEAPPAEAAVDPPSRKTVEVALGAGLGWTSALGVGVSPELAVFGGIDVSGRSLRLGASFARSSMRSTPLGTARFERWALHLEGCPVTAMPVARVRVAPCARATGGALRGSGETIENAESSSLLWLSAGVRGRLLLELGRSLFAETELGVDVPLFRHGFYVRPNDVVQRVPVLVAEGALSLGCRF